MSQKQSSYRAADSESAFFSPIFPESESVWNESNDFDSCLSKIVTFLERLIFNVSYTSFNSTLGQFNQ